MKNNRTFLEKLLDGAEVEWKTLNEIFHLKNGYTPSKGVKEYWENGSIPWFRMEDIRENGRVLNTALQKVSESAVKGGKLFPANSIIIATSATIGEHALITIPFLANQRFTVLSLKPEYIDKFNIYFLYHYCFTLDDWCQKNTTMSSFASVDMNGFRKFPIPIPPLSVQTEIVKILDALTALTSELTSELILRQKQYEYYREKLLSEEELEKVGFEWRTLEELVEKTQNIKWKNNTKTYRYIDLTSVDRENNSITGTNEINALNAPSRAQKIVKENDIIFATTRPTQQRIASITKEFSGEIASTGYCVLRANTDIVLPKWLFYFLSTINFKNYVEENQSGSAYPAISDSKVKEFRIPVPDVTIQQSIIEKLDKFYDLTNSLLHGLPKEINNRTKQYLYYQKELLNFKGEDL